MATPTPPSSAAPSDHQLNDLQRAKEDQEAEEAVAGEERGSSINNNDDEDEEEEEEEEKEEGRGQEEATDRTDVKHRPGFSIKEPPHSGDLGLQALRFSSDKKRQRSQSESMELDD